METFENVDLEQNILAAMTLKGGEKIPAVLKMELTAEDFTEEKNRILFSHIVGLYLRGGNPEQVALVEEMKSAGDFDKVGVEYFILVVHGTTYTNAYIEEHVRMLKEKTNKRKFIELMDTLNCQAKTGIKSIADIIADASAEFSRFTADDETTRFTVLKNYFKNDFEHEAQEIEKYANRKTGYKNLDEQQIFLPDVYVLGGLPALGKTTFAWQMAEQLAEEGEMCIYCSYEMSRLELFTKTLSRELFKRNSKVKISAAEIRRGGWKNEEVQKVVKELQKDDLDLRVLELHNETIDDLLRILRPLCTKQKKSPIVFIDYLQIIPSTKDNAKLAVDDTLHKLKDFQRDTYTTFVVLSSLNRSNYTQPISFESFKESGGIEFSAGCAWGLQLDVVNTLENEKNVSEIRKKIDEAKKEPARKIQLKCVKNRNGTNYDCYFKYHSAHDYFEPCEKSDFEENKTSRVRH